MNVEFISWQDLLTDTVNHLNHVIIQRDAIPSEAVNWCLESLKNNNINYDYEIDDDLLNVPESIDIDETYKKYKPYFKSFYKMLNVCM